MKKILCALFLSLVLCGHAFADGFNPYIAGSTVASGGADYTNCSTCNETNQIFLWTGDYASDTDKACKDSTTGLDGTFAGASESVVDSSSDPGTESPGSGGNVLKVTTTGDYLRWAITTEDIFKHDEGRLTFYVYMAATTGTNHLTRLYGDADNYILTPMIASGSIEFDLYGNATRISGLDSSSTVPDTTWTLVQVAWTESGNEFSCKIGDNAWQDSTDPDTLDGLTTIPSYFHAGSAATITDTFYIDDIKIYSAYSKP